ncbi:MAG TPA: HAD-IC family P-type ATPase [Chloroflexota bacterium]
MTIVDLPRPESGLTGLTEEEAAARKRQGLDNRLPPPTGRTYSQIVRENVFTFINNVLFGLGIALVLLGRWSDALVSIGVVSVNLVVGVAQEIRAKRTLDRIALLTRPTATIVRDGHSRVADPAEVVAGDLVLLGPGDQVVADGTLVGRGRIDLDESLLTGESHELSKTAGDSVYSGSFCTAGSAAYLAEKVGSTSFANELTATARAFRRVLTPLQRQVNVIVRLILLVAVTLGMVLVADAFVSGVPLVESVRMVVVVAGLVPNGLFLAIAVAYALAAVRIARKGALVQQSNAVESLSHVDTLCLDKTGTLTTGRLRLEAAQPLSSDALSLTNALGDYVANISGRNRTSDAIAAACPGQQRQVRQQVAFSSARKWSALVFDDPGLPGVYALGAPEALLRHVAESGGIAARVDALAAQGLRVLLFARDPLAVSINDADGEAALPERLEPLGLLTLRDELRPAAAETLAAFGVAGVRLKLISGDHPQAIRAVAVQAGFPEDCRVATGSDLEQWTEDHEQEPAQLCQLIDETAIFGRVGPRQKEQIVSALRQTGHYVAMVGDGVNDVLALKRANLAIAMQAGTQAARAVADLVLLEDSFEVLPSAVREGQRIVRGLLDILRLFLVRVVYTALLIVFVGLIESGFPLGPKHNALLALLTVGIPTLALAAWARPAPVPRGGVSRWLAHFVVPAAWLLALVGFVVYLAYFIPARSAALHLPAGGQQAAALLGARLLAQTMTMSVSVVCGLLLIVFAEPPSPAWTGGAPLGNDRRPAILAAGLLLAFLATVVVPPLRVVFDLAPLSPLDLAVIGGIAVAWAAALRWSWREQLLERLLRTSET